MASTSSSDTKIDNLVKVMERILEKINLNDRVPPRENQNKNRNQNLRRDPNQDRQRDNDQQIRPPFQQNCVDQEEEREVERLEENHVNLIGSESETNVFLIEEEQGFLSSEQTEYNNEDYEDYRLGFENAIMEVHKQCNIRRKGSPYISNDKNTSTVVKRTLENKPKKTASNINIVAKKTNTNK